MTSRDHEQEALTWLRKAAPQEWKKRFRYAGVPLASMDREALIGLIYVQDRSIARKGIGAVKPRTQEATE